MFLDFEKWHGSKNDFIVTWISSTDKDMLVPTLLRLAPKICTKDGSGIGSDGILILIYKNKKDPVPEELIIINSNGSIAKNCGNGLRCAARSAQRRALKEGIDEFLDLNIMIDHLNICCQFMGHAVHPFVAVTMPIPKLGDKNSWDKSLKNQAHEISKKSSVKIIEIESIEIGNPHIVIQVEQATSDLAALFGKPMQSPDYGDGYNVHIIESLELSDQDLQRAKKDLGDLHLSELYRVFPWERGVGPTQSCGTGACAVAAAILNLGFTVRSSWIAIDMPGGRLYVKQDQEDGPVILAGPASFVFAGTIEI